MQLIIRTLLFFALTIASTGLVALPYLAIQ
jgi:hypothetical protein